MYDNIEFLDINFELSEVEYYKVTLMKAKTHLVHIVE